MSRRPSDSVVAPKHREVERVDLNAFETVATTWSLPTSNYQTQPNGWLQGLTNRLKRVPQWEITVGRMP